MDHARENNFDINKMVRSLQKKKKKKKMNYKH